MTNDELDELSEQIQNQYLDQYNYKLTILEPIEILGSKLQKFKSKKGWMKTKDWLDTMNFIKKIPLRKG